ncbi:MAG: hypothetical protein CMB61_06550 [Euryarchaeota archaeon]|nr:hypothetical protein [Euryarchaeota archaeon]|tara:strand:- start:44 stop:382 length:339 start_codon:yes stop_codon:yes gene_type:complete
MLEMLFVYPRFRRLFGFFLISFWTIFCIFGIFRLLDNPRHEEVDFFRELWKYPAMAAMFGLILFITSTPALSNESSNDDEIPPQQTSSDQEGRLQEKVDDGSNWWEFESEQL